MMKFKALLAKYPRLAITGAPRTGKTTLTNAVSDRPVIHTDDWKEWPWGEVPALVQSACDEAGDSFVVEGVMVPRTLRKGLEVDAVLYLGNPKVQQSDAQIAMGKGTVDKVLNEWREAHPDVPVITEDDFDYPTLDHGDLPRSTRRYTTFTLDAASVEPTPQGGRRFRARASKAGVFRYNRKGRVLREYRPASELQKPEALASLKGATVVMLHPVKAGGEVNTANFGQLNVGHFEDPEFNAEDEAIDGWVVINDGNALAQIDKWGGADISCGYDNGRDPNPGLSPKGEPFDLTQTDYIFNHVAIGPPGWGRQGQDVGLTLDSDDNQASPELPNEENMALKNAPAQGKNAPTDPKIKTSDEGDATDKPNPDEQQTQDEALSPEDIAGIRTLLKMLPDLNEMLNAGRVEGEGGGAQGAQGATLDTDTGDKDKSSAEKTMDQADVERIAQESAEVRTEAMRLLGAKYSSRGKTTRQVKLDVVRTLDSSFSDKVSDERLAGAYEAAIPALTERTKRAQELQDELGKTRRAGARTLDSKDTKQRPPLGSHVFNRKKSA